MDTVHPLLLPNVLSNIFTNFCPEDLAEFRLVNIDWNHAVCTILGHKQLISFTSPNDLKSYMSIFRQASIHPHASFKIHFTISEETYLEIVQFITEFKPYIRSLLLTVGSGYFDDTQLKCILENLPSLEVLGIRFNYFKCPRLELTNEDFKLSPLPYLKGLRIEMEGYETSSDFATKLLCRIFEAAPNLNSILHPIFCIPPTKCRIPSKMNIFLTQLILETDDMLVSSSLRKLSYLNFIAKINENNIQDLLEKKYPLKHLYMNMWYPDDFELCVTPMSLKFLMSQLAPCLEKLGLDFPWRKPVAYEFVFQLRMRNLTYLSLNGFQGSLLLLLEKLPRLRSMELSQLDFQEILPSAQSTDVYPNVERLRLDFCTSQTAGAISRFSRIFPGLKVLDINHVGNEASRMVFRKMLALNLLRLHGDDLTDEGITGIPLEVAKENNLILKTSKGDSLRRFPFIGDLPNLTHLKLEAYQLTEACIQHGLVHCTSLQFVSMDTRLERNDPSETITRTFEFGKSGQKETSIGKIILQEEMVTDEDEDARNFFLKYEKGLATDLLFV